MDARSSPMVSSALEEALAVIAAVEGAVLPPPTLPQAVVEGVVLPPPTLSQASSMVSPGNILSRVSALLPGHIILPWVSAVLPKDNILPRVTAWLPGHIILPWVSAVLPKDNILPRVTAWLPGHIILFWVTAWLPKNNIPPRVTALLPRSVCMVNSPVLGKRKADALEDWMMVPISFPPVEVFSIHPVVVQIRLANYEVNKAYVDTGSSMNIIYDHCFRKLPAHVQASKVPPQFPLVGFSGETHWPIGEVSMAMMLGDYPTHRVEDISFAIVDAPSSYNVLLGRPALQKFQAIPSTIHGMIKFPTPAGIATVRGRTSWPKECQQVEHPPSKEGSTSTAVQPRVESSLQDPEEKIIINDKFPEQPVIIGSHLPPQVKDRLVKLLKSNLDVFAWQTSDMTGVPRNLAEHALHANPNIVPIRQKKRGMAPDRSKSACDQVDKMVQADIVREVKYQTWIANPVMVKKGDGL